MNQQKLDLDRGSENLQFLSWGAFAIGGLLFTVISGALLERDRPDLVFCVLAFLGLVIFIFSWFLDPELESDNEDFI